MSDDERLARVALSRLTEPGEPKIASLVAQLGAIRLRELLSDPDQESPEARDVATRLRDLDPPAELARAHRLGLRYVVPGDEEWPTQIDDLMRAELLDHRGGPPLGLWVKGPTRLDRLTGAVAVVGARSATTYGTEMAASIAGGLVRAGHPVVSGAAFGIDQAAHRGALAVDGANIAILACGADRAYPTAHKDLLDHLGRTSAVVAEVPPGCAPDSGPLPQPQPADRGAHPGDRRGGGGGPQRGTQHRQLGHSAEPSPDGCPRPRDECAVAGSA